MIRKLLFAIFVLVSVVAFSQGQSSGAVLDLSGWNPAQKEIITLNGPWEFYWNKLLTPSDFRSSSLPKPDLLVMAGSWGDVKINSAPVGNKGCATYRLHLKNLPATALMLDVYSVQTSCRVFMNDSLVLETGKPGTSRETTQPMNRDAVVSVPGNTRDLELVVQIANYHHRKGGFVHPFELGLAVPVVKQHSMYYLLDVAESSALAIIGLFLLALYTFRRKDVSVLYFALFCMTLSLRPVIAVNYLMSVIFPEISWSLLLKMEYLAVMFPCLFMLLFIKKLFPDQMPSAFVKLFSAIMIVKIAITLFFPPAVFSWLIPPLLIIIPSGVILFAITIIRAIAARVEGATQAGFGLIILLCSLILKVLVYASILPPVHVLITLLDIGFIFMMSLILGSRFSIQFSKVERLQRTTEMQRREIEQKKEAIEEQNKNIIDSINYAKRIQDSLLPKEKFIDERLKKLQRK